MKKIRMSNVSLVITLRCSLKCKLCTAFAPYYKNPPHYPLEMLKKSVVKYFELVEYVDKFTINGGEAIMHNDLPELIDFLAGYIDHIGMLEFLTNGTLVPSERLLKSLSFSPKVNIMVNNYGNNLSGKIQEIKAGFEKYNIAYRLRDQNEEKNYCGGWVDISDVSPKSRTEKETEELFSHCVYPNAFRCFAIFGDKAYICGVYLWCHTNGIVSDNPDEYVDFSDSCTLSPEEQIEKINHFFDKPRSTCSLCNGFCPESKRYTPAEQLASDELTHI
ncbi:MAG: radical SAM protein [Ruminococcaceae bacterium]|nr:radical SAM protein [Oscillospiraceae bacterium]